MEVDKFHDNQRIIYTLVDSELVVGTNPDTFNEIHNALPVDNPPKHVILPEYVSGYKVTRIGKAAFRYSLVESVVISSTIIKIDHDSFGRMPNLKQVRFAEGSQLKEIYIGAFYKCPKLKEIRIPPLVSSISELAFGENSFESFYYCGDTVFNDAGKMFSNFTYTFKQYPRNIYVKESYNSSYFSDCSSIIKTNRCYVPIKEWRSTHCNRKYSSFSVSIFIFILVNKQ